MSRFVVVIHVLVLGWGSVPDGPAVSFLHRFGSSLNAGGEPMRMGSHGVLDPMTAPTRGVVHETRRTNRRTTSTIVTESTDEAESGHLSASALDDYDPVCPEPWSNLTGCRRRSPPGCHYRCQRRTRFTEIYERTSIMDWDSVAPMILAVVFIIVTAGTILLYPLSRRLARLLEAITQEKSRILPQNERRIEETLVRMDARLERLEEEQRFLRRGWLNIDLLWGWILILTGVLTPMI